MIDVDLAISYSVVPTRFRNEPRFGEVQDALHEACSQVFEDLGLHLKEFSMQMHVGR